MDRRPKAVELETCEVLPGAKETHGLKTHGTDAIFINTGSALSPLWPKAFLSNGPAATCSAGSTSFFKYRRLA